MFWLFPFVVAFLAVTCVSVPGVANRYRARAYRMRLAEAVPVPIFETKPEPMGGKAVAATAIERSEGEEPEPATLRWLPKPRHPPIRARTLPNFDFDFAA